MPSRSVRSGARTTGAPSAMQVSDGIVNAPQHRLGGPHFCPPNVGCLLSSEHWTPSFPECQKTRVGRSPTTFSASLLRTPQSIMSSAIQAEDHRFLAIPIDLATGPPASGSSRSVSSRSNGASPQPFTGGQPTTDHQYGLTDGILGGQRTALLM